MCGGRLHGLCEELEDPDSDEPMHRVCQTCAITKATATGSSSGGKSPSTGKRKAHNTRGRGNIGTGKKHASDSKSKSRTRLNFGQKNEILGLLREKIAYGEIARRFKCGATAIGNIAKKRAALEEEFATALLQELQDKLMTRVNTTHVAGDPYDDELDDGETVESTGEGVVAGGSKPPPSYAERCLFLALWSISPSHVAMTKQETFCVGRGCRLSEILLLNEGGRQT